MDGIDDGISSVEEGKQRVHTMHACMYVCMSFISNMDCVRIGGGWGEREIDFASDVHECCHKS